MEKCCICNGPLFLLGILGTMIHFRCIDCGMESYREAQEEELEELGGWQGD